MKFEFSLPIFEKNTNSNFYETFLAGTELFQADGRTDTQTGRQMDVGADRQTDRHDEYNSRFSQFCEKSLKTDLI